jgi:hypothetical protein
MTAVELIATTGLELIAAELHFRVELTEHRSQTNEPWYRITQGAEGFVGSAGECHAWLEGWRAGAASGRGLTDDELRIALANVGVDITCGACAELFYTGHYNAKHTHARKEI